MSGDKGPVLPGDTRATPRQKRVILGGLMLLFVLEVVGAAITGIVRHDFPSGTFTLIALGAGDFVVALLLLLWLGIRAWRVR